MIIEKFAQRERIFFCAQNLILFSGDGKGPRTKIFCQGAEMALPHAQEMCTIQDGGVPSHRYYSSLSLSNKDISYEGG